jgi:hypothetical protein
MVLSKPPEPVAARPQQLLQHIRWLSCGANPPADGELLTRFARLGDEDAFAELVRRHGPGCQLLDLRLDREGPDELVAVQGSLRGGVHASETHGSVEGRHKAIGVVSDPGGAGGQRRTGVKKPAWSRESDGQPASSDNPDGVLL